MLDKIRQSMYYVIIAITSVISLTFLPMIGSRIGLAWNVPNTVVGWIVWIAVKLCVASINVLIFHSFMQQAKLNIKDNPKYVEAKEILMQVSSKIVLPRSPQQWNRKQYGQKGATIFISTALATIALTQAILSFDWISMLTYLFTIILGLIFGVIQMKTAEEYWTDEFWRYAIMVRADFNRGKSVATTEGRRSNYEKQVKEAMDMAKSQCDQQGNDSMGTNSRTDILVTSNNNSCTCNANQSLVLDSNDSNNSILGRAIYPCSTSTDRSSIINKEVIL